MRETTPGQVLYRGLSRLFLESAPGDPAFAAWLADWEELNDREHAAFDDLAASVIDAAREPQPGFTGHPACDAHRRYAVVTHAGSFAYGFAATRDGLRVYDDRDEFEYAKEGLRVSETTPGRAAYEAFMRSLAGRSPDVPVVLWDRLDDLPGDGHHPGKQDDWEAAAQAAVDAFLAGGSVSAESIREALAAHEEALAERGHPAVTGSVWNEAGQILIAAPACTASAPCGRCAAEAEAFSAARTICSGAAMRHG